MFFTRISSLLALSFLSAQLVHTQSTTSSSNSAETTATPVLVPGNSNYEYFGCFNETTGIPGAGGIRALASGNGEPFYLPETMTVEKCLAECKTKGSNYAGLEYSRECFCAPYVNSLALKLPEANCSLPCDGNKTQICGGVLKLSVYKEKASSKGAGTNIAGDAPVGSILALGIAMGTLLLLA